LNFPDFYVGDFLFPITNNLKQEHGNLIPYSPKCQYALQFFNFVVDLADPVEKRFLFIFLNALDEL